MSIDNKEHQSQDPNFDINQFIVSRQNLDDGVLREVELSFSPENYDDILKNAEIDLSKDLNKPPVILKFDDSDIFSIGDFSCITGKAKSRKTFFVSLLVTSFLNGSLPRISTIKHSNKKRILWFDTEQSRYHVANAKYRVNSLSNNTNNYDLKVLSLRSYTPYERKELIDYLLTVKNPQKDIALVIIDGIRDLITDINNPEQATFITSWLMKVTSEAELHICTVLHQNKSDANARGHLGTEIVNKGQTILSVKKDDGFSIIEAEQCRDKEFEPFAFKVDNNLPYIVEDYRGKTQERSNKRSATDVPLETQRLIINEIFAKHPDYSRADLLINIKLKYAERSFYLSDKATIEFLHHALNNDLILHNGGKTKNVKYSLFQ
jgi:hypothetical protein